MFLKDHADGSSFLKRHAEDCLLKPVKTLSFSRERTEEKIFVWILKSNACGKNLFAEHTDKMKEIVYENGVDY